MSDVDKRKELTEKVRSIQNAARARIEEVEAERSKLRQAAQVEVGQIVQEVVIVRERAIQRARIERNAKRDAAADAERRAVAAAHGARRSAEVAADRAFEATREAACAAERERLGPAREAMGRRLAEVEAEAAAQKLAVTTHAEAAARPLLAELDAIEGRARKRDEREAAKKKADEVVGQQA